MFLQFCQLLLCLNSAEYILLPDFTDCGNISIDFHLLLLSFLVKFVGIVSNCNADYADCQAECYYGVIHYG